MIFYLEGYIFLFHNCLLYFDIVIENKILLEVEFRFEDIKELPLLITLKKNMQRVKHSMNNLQRLISIYINE